MNFLLMINSNVYNCCLIIQIIQITVKHSTRFLDIKIKKKKLDNDHSYGCLLLAATMSIAPLGEISFDGN